MKTFSDIINEATEESEFTVEEVQKTVLDAWNKYFPKSNCWHFKNGIGSDKYMIFTCTIGKDKSEFINGIDRNDPLNLSFSIDLSRQPVTITYKSNSIAISPPEGSYLAYGREKLKLRKTKVKNMKDLKTKLEKAFSTTKETIKTLLKDGKFDAVYSRDGIVDMIKKKVS